MIRRALAAWILVGGVRAGLTVARVLADTSSPPTSLDPILQLAQYGILGIVFFAVVRGWLWPKPMVDDVRAARDHALEQRDALLEGVQDKVFPAVASLAQIGEVLVPALGNLGSKLERVERVNDDLLAEVRALRVTLAQTGRLDLPNERRPDAPR